ncbi:MAG: cobalamin-dependent protein, partial [Acidimicrobiales bacterium]
MYSKLYLRLEPLGLERVATSLRKAGHTVRMVDLQVYSGPEMWRAFEELAPDAVGFSLNYLANV